MNRYSHTYIIKDAKKIESDGTETTVRRRSTTLYPSFMRSGTGNTIISQDGDRLDLLAKEFYGDERLWFVIARANNLGKGSLVIPKGIAVIIPYETTNGISSLLFDYNTRR
jgi:nucleoid-associated protein YgaU